MTPEPSSETRRFNFSSRPSTDTRWPTSPILEDEDDLPTPRPDRPEERTPLLAARGSSSHLSIGLPPPITSTEEDTRHYAALGRRRSTTSVRSKASLKPKHYHVGHSTFAQTVCISNVLGRPASETDASRDSCSTPSRFFLASACSQNPSRSRTPVGLGEASSSLAMASFRATRAYSSALLHLFVRDV